MFPVFVPKAHLGFLCSNNAQSLAKFYKFFHQFSNLDRKKNPHHLKMQNPQIDIEQLFFASNHLIGSLFQKRDNLANIRLWTKQTNF